MNTKNLSDLSDQELLQEAKKVKSSAVAHAFIIGFLVGIVIYSVVQNTWGFLTLIPLFFIYKLVGSSTNKEELGALLKERNLK